MPDDVCEADSVGATTNRFAAFDAALTGIPMSLVDREGRALPTDPARWYAPADPEDRWILDRCMGRTLDLGCGPGRLVAALGEQGVDALGVDCSERAVRECHARGGAAVHQDLFETVPDEGEWDHVVLADGNIGIGGNPRRLLQRAARMLRHGGTMLVETAPSAGPHALDSVEKVADLWWRGQAGLVDLADPAWPVVWFPWAVVGARALTALAGRLGLQTVDQHAGARQFVQLLRGG